jgi:hypothetical protein
MRTDSFAEVRDDRAIANERAASLVFLQAAKGIRRKRLLNTPRKAMAVKAPVDI